MIEKIKNFLRSDDIEMVQLGALLLTQNIPTDDWEKILNECLHEDNLHNMIYGNGFSYLIEDNKTVSIVENPWTSISTRQYKIRTGSAGMKLFQDAMIKKCLTK